MLTAPRIVYILRLLHLNIGLPEVSQENEVWRRKLAYKLIIAAEDSAKASDRELSKTLLRRFGFQLFRGISTTSAPGTDESQSPRKLVLSFAALQRMKLAKLASSLANRIMTMKFHGEEPPDWEDLLKEYS